MAITFNGAYLEGFMADHELKALAPAVKAAHEALHGKTGLGNDFLVWLDLPTNYDKSSASAAPIWEPGRSSSCSNPSCTTT